MILSNIHRPSLLAERVHVYYETVFPLFTCALVDAVGPIVVIVRDVRTFVFRSLVLRWSDGPRWRVFLLM
jgi:hypothetical protein